MTSSDPQEAEAAVRNLHNYEINGRNLRVDFAESDPAQEKTRKRGPGGGGMPGGMSGMPPTPMPMSMPTAGLPPNLPPGVPLPPGTNATDSISQTLATMPPNQLLDILTQMKVSMRQGSRSALSDWKSPFRVWSLQIPMTPEHC